MKEEIKKKFTSLYRNFYFYIYKRAFLFFRSDDIAKDITQDVFYKVLCKLEQGDEKVLNKNYLIKIATNKCLDTLKKKRAISIEENRCDATISNGKEFRVYLSQIIERIPSSLKEIAVYHFLDGFTLDEIVKISKIPKRTLERRIKKLKKILATFS